MNKKTTADYFLVNRRERWGLSIYGWIFIIIMITLPVYIGFRNLYSILAPVQREKTDILVLEGFISDYVLQAAINEFRGKHYSLLITTGTPLEYGDLLAPYRNTARVAGMSLIKLGFDSTKLVMIGTDEIRNDRTYNSAIKLKKWMVSHRPDINAVNLMTMSVHGGRSLLLFKAALGDSIRVGIISVPNFYYGQHSWWKSSKGFRETINEAIGYFYVRYFFRPYEKELSAK
ncbi:MAG: YdcF family protein [Bacteroidota bacterium]